MIYLRINFAYFIGITLFLLNGCGSDRIYDIEPMPEEVSSVRDIPNCTPKYSGEQIYVMELGKTLVCDDGKWKDSSDVKSSSSQKNSGGTSSSSTINGEPIKRDWEYLDHYVDGGTLIDSRDKKKYSTVIINGKRWMAENLRYIPGTDSNGTTCFKGVEEYCKTMGPMYHYSVKGIPQIKRDEYFDAEDIFEFSVFPPSENICPEGWKLPTSKDWDDVIEAAGKLNTMRSPSGSPYFLSALLDSSWNLFSWDSVIIAGTNRLGFNVKGFPLVIRKNMIQNNRRITTIESDSIPFWFTIYSPYTLDLFNTSQKSQIVITPGHGSFINEDNKASTYAFVRCVEKDDNDKYEIRTGTMTDDRYDDVYKIVKIGSLWWMAEDLHFKENPDDCYPYTINECYYTYNQVMEYPEPNYVCPEGWRLPTKLDWYNMFFYVDMYNGKNNAIESVTYTRDSTGKIPSEIGLDLKSGESYFTSSIGYYFNGFSHIPLQYLVDISGDHFYYGQSFLHLNDKSRVRCVKDVQVEE